MSAAELRTRPGRLSALTGGGGGGGVAGLLQRNGALAVLVLLGVVASVAVNGFAAGDNLRNIAGQNSFLAIVAIGMTFVIISGGIDLSVGSVYALGGVLAAWGAHHGWPVALLLPVGVCGLIGLVQGLLVARLRMAPFIVTLAGLLGVRGLVLAITHEGATTYTVAHRSPFTALGQGAVFGVAAPAAVALVVAVLAAVVLNRTRYGLSVFAIGGAEDAAALMGLPVPRNKAAVYVVSASLAGLAGALLAARSSSGSTIVGVGLELDAIAAVVIGGALLSGGAGTISGTVCGVLLLGVIQNLINRVPDINSSWQSVVSGGFLVVVVLVQTWLSRRQRL